MAEIVATTSLPVDRLTATNWNAADRAKIEALRIFWKINIFRETLKKLKIPYLEIRCSSEKGPPGTLNGPIGPIFLDRSKVKPQT